MNTSSWSGGCPVTGWGRRPGTTVNARAGPCTRRTTVTAVTSSGTASSSGAASAISRPAPASDSAPKPSPRPVARRPVPITRVCLPGRPVLPTGGVPLLIRVSLSWPGRTVPVCRAGGRRAVSLAPRMRVYLGLPAK